MKKGISSLELAALVNELQFLVKGKVTQIYHQEKKEVLLQLHAPGKGKSLLKIIPGKFLCLTNEKHPPIRPTGFCMNLRKYLGNAFIKKIYQQDAERIVVFEFDKKGVYYLVVELFSKGNIVLCDDDWSIISVLQWQKWRDRVVKPKEKYVFPKPGFNWKKVTIKGVEEILSKSEKKNVVVSLATEVGLGGTYAEEVCLRANVDKDLKPSEVDAAAIVKVIKEMVSLVDKPAGHIYDEEITPFPISEGKPKKVATYNEAINTLKVHVTVSPFEKKIASLKKMISEQEEAISMQEENINVNTAKGDLVYAKYADLQKVLDYVSGARKDGKEWKEIGSTLDKLKRVESVDLKGKKVVLDL